jgi:hypothetical protein
MMAHPFRNAPAAGRGHVLPLTRLPARSHCHGHTEPLERRVFLSSVLAPATSNLHDIQTGPLAKAGGNLADLYLSYSAAKKDHTLAPFQATTRAQTSLPGGSPLDVSGNTVGVELVGIGTLAAFERSMQAQGLSIQSITPNDKAIAGFIPIGMLSQVAQSPDVLHITPLDKPIAHQEGEAPNQADQAMQVAEARSTYGLTGEGVTIGVISDSVNQVGNGLANSEASGDLPDDVRVIHDGTSDDTDEGRALLEEIYDLAPDASLVFDTAGESQQSMASAVAALQSAGCNVIIDDIGFADEPFFQPGVIDRAIDTAVSDGVTYVTSAGNNGTSGFEQAATFVSANDGSGDQLINFNAGGTAATMMNITITQAGQLTLEWDDAYDGVTGTVKADLQFNLYSSNGILRYSAADNTFETGVPVQQIANVNPGNYQVQIVAVDTPTADLPHHYEFTGDFTMTTTQYSGLRTSVVGHVAFADAISVGAVPFYDVPPFSGSGMIPTEDFSSAGPVVESRDINGNLLSAAQTIDTPQVSGADGNNTSFFGSPGTDDPTSLPQFFGTSAAAGNVAAVAVLMKQADPGATQAQILAAMEATTIPVNGQTAGTYDTTAGYGLVDAVAAVGQLNGSLIPTVSIAAVSPNPSSTPINSIDINFNQAVTGFGLSDLSLTLGGGANLLTDGQTLISGNGKNFVLGNLSSLTDETGTYALTLTAAGSGITASGGGTLQTGAQAGFQVNLPVPAAPAEPSELTATALSGGSIELSFSESSTNESGFVLQRSTSRTFKTALTRIQIPPGTPGSNIYFTDSGLSPGTVYYYRVEAFDSGGTSSVTQRVSTPTLPAGQIIVDNASQSGVTLTGTWTASTAASGYYGNNYLQDDDSGKGTKNVKFHPNLPAAGRYFVYANWPRAAGNATNVSFDIYSKAGVLLRTVRENEQSTGGDGWVLLGEFTLHSSTPSFVVIRNNGTSGEVLADAIKFVPAG